MSGIMPVRDLALFRFGRRFSFSYVRISKDFRRKDEAISTYRKENSALESRDFNLVATEGPIVEANISELWWNSARSKECGKEPLVVSINLLHNLPTRFTSF